MAVQTCVVEAADATMCVCSFSPTCESEGLMGDFRCTACQAGYEGKRCER